MNIRIVIFIAMLAVLIGIPTYMYFDSVLSGGIKVRADGVYEVDLKAMSSFPFSNENGTLNDVPKQWRELDGKKVVLVGEMWNPEAAGQYVQDFSLVYSIQKCCFSGPPQIQHFVQSTTPDRRPLPYYSGPVRVLGTLRVNVVKDEELGKVTSVYQLEVEKLERA